jgi:thioredoxin 1
MPVFDTPISTDADGLPRILNAGLPVILYLYNASSEALDGAFSRVAKDYSGELLVAKVDASANPSVHAGYDNIALPALLTLDEDNVESQAANIRPADVDAHADFLTGNGPYPQDTAAEREAHAEAGSAPVHVSDTSFKAEVLESDIPVLVDFWAEWCGPCHMIAPTLEKFAEQYAGKLKVAKLNVDQYPQIAGAFQVQGIPMLLLFKNGEPVGKLVGAHPPHNIEAMIRKAL